MLALYADEREAPAERRLTLSPEAEAQGETAEPDMSSLEEMPPEPPLAGPAPASDMSPVALATLTQRGQQIACGALPLGQVGEADQASAQQDTLRTPYAAVLDALTTLHTALQALQTRRRAGGGSAAERPDAA